MPDATLPWAQITPVYDRYSATNRTINSNSIQLNGTVAHWKPVDELMEEKINELVEKLVEKKVRELLLSKGFILGRAPERADEDLYDKIMEGNT